MMAAHGITVSAQEMIIRLTERPLYRRDCTQCSTRHASAAVSSSTTGLPDICQISPAPLLRPPIFYILKNCCCSSSSSSSSSSGSSSGSSSSSSGSSSSTMQQHHAAARCSSTVQQHRAAAPCSSTVQQHRAAAPCSGTMQQHHAAAPCSSNMQQQDAAAPCSSKMQQQGPHPFIPPIGYLQALFKFFSKLNIIFFFLQFNIFLFRITMLGVILT